ncbi:hypothetical protein, variant [Fonticula alba]|nr:hypothetical protein, variant [Fonticula alba]KCV71564.1 hypothetical protein, variant [Fonticula alba]|eukprot:XP_009494686.1 hypothetical protein, variant [Fonticula alba]
MIGGSATSPAFDIESIHMAWRLICAYGLGEVCAVHLNSLGDADARSRFRQALHAFLSKHVEHLSAESRRRVDAGPAAVIRVLDSKRPEDQHVVTAPGAPKLEDFLSPAARNHLQVVADSLRAAGVPVLINHQLVRGLDYYNDLVFEIIPHCGPTQVGAGGGATVPGSGSAPDAPAHSTLLAGGRYDMLAGQLGFAGVPGGAKPAPGEVAPLPAFGWALGVDRVAAYVHRPPATVPSPSTLEDLRFMVICAGTNVHRHQAGPSDADPALERLSPAEYHDQVSLHSAEALRARGAEAVVPVSACSSAKSLRRQLGAIYDRLACRAPESPGAAQADGPVVDLAAFAHVEYPAASHILFVFSVDPLAAERLPTPEGTLVHQFKWIARHVGSELERDVDIFVPEGGPRSARDAARVWACEAELRRVMTVTPDETHVAGGPSAPEPVFVPLASGFTARLSPWFDSRTKR